MKQMRLFLFVFMSLFVKETQAEISQEIWQQVEKGEVFVLIRHALAPGTGDPARFNVKDCSTQRNLNSDGRFQAQEMGKLFQKRGLGKITLYSSQWCRCLDTATEMALGDVVELPLINSFFRNMEKGPVQTAQTRAWLRERRGKGPVVLITHQVNITALADLFPSSGELIFTRFGKKDALEVVGRLQTR